MTREECDLMALEYLRDGGPHTIGVIDTEEKMGAALVFADLRNRGLVATANFGSGMVQHTITKAGLEFTENNSRLV